MKTLTLIALAFILSGCLSDQEFARRKDAYVKEQLQSYIDAIDLAALHKQVEPPPALPPGTPMRPTLPLEMAFGLSATTCSRVGAAEGGVDVACMVDQQNGLKLGFALQQAHLDMDAVAVMEFWTANPDGAVIIYPRADKDVSPALSRQFWDHEYIGHALLRLVHCHGPHSWCTSDGTPYQ